MQIGCLTTEVFFVTVVNNPDNDKAIGETCKRVIGNIYNNINILINDSDSGPG